MAIDEVIVEPVLVEFDLETFIHNEPNNVVTQQALQYQNQFRDLATCWLANSFRRMKLYPVNYLMNDRYIFAKVLRQPDLIRSIEKIIVLDEFKNPIQINSTFLSVNDIQKIIPTENNLNNINIPIKDLPFCALSVGIDIVGFGHNPKYIYLETTEVLQCDGLPNNIAGIPVDNGVLVSDNISCELIDNSDVFTVLPYKDYILPYYELECLTNEDFLVQLDLNNIVLQGPASELHIIPKADYCHKTIKANNNELQFKVYPNVDIQEERQVSIFGRNCRVRDGMIGVSIE